MKLSRITKLIGLASLLAGFVLLAPFGYFWLQQRALASSATTKFIPLTAPLPDPKPDMITGKPVSLSIPSVSIAVEVVDGPFNDKTKQWALTLSKAHYALPSMQPNNESGNTLIYGHYRPEVFAYLHLIKPGAELTLVTDNGYRFNYHFREAQTVDPTNVDIFSYTGKPQLTVQTCTGTYMENRRLYFFDLVDVTKI